jgi:chromosome partitioning protein
MTPMMEAAYWYEFAGVYVMDGDARREIPVVSKRYLIRSLRNSSSFTSSCGPVASARRGGRLAATPFGRGCQRNGPLIATLRRNGQEGAMIAPPEVEYRVTPGLGWPLNVEVDPRIGWPNVPRETLDWPERVTAQLVPNDQTATTPSSPTIDIPPGPRRARFDEDEFSSPLLNDDPPAAATADRLTTASLAAPSHTRIFVVANQKGGVGKTTTSVNLAAALALGGLSVLLVDLDPQGNATTALGVDHPPGTLGTYEVMMSGAALADHVVDSPEAPNLKVLPATIDLAGAEIELVSVVARESRLLRAIRAYLKEHHADYVFLDCPPSLGLLTLNALVAANEILVPIQCEYYALEGVTQLMRTIDLVKGELNHELRLTTVILTMFDARTKLAAQVAQEVLQHFPSETLTTVVPRSVRISEAPSYGQTVLTYQPSSAGAVSYLEAAQEIARRGVEENT